MYISVVMPELEIHCTPLEEISINSYCAKIRFDDINEQRYEMIVQPYQAIRITTIDCVSAKYFYNDFCYRDGYFHRHILQVQDSDYLNDLLLKSGNADFVKKSKHYLLPFQDNIVEFIADKFIISKV